MGTLKRIADALEQIAKQSEVLVWKFERIAVALEPKKTALDTAIEKSKAEKPKRRRTKKYPGLIGLEPWRQSHGLKGYAEITAYCDKEAIKIVSIKGHPYVNEADLPKIEKQFAR